MIQFFEDDADDAPKCDTICVSEEHVQKTSSYPRTPIIFRSRSRKSSDQWLSAVNRIRIGVRVMRGFQFYSSRSLARAVGDGRSVKERSGARDKDLGHFPVILRKICKKIRSEDQCLVVVELTSPQPEASLHYLVMIRHRSNAGDKEDMLVGCEATIKDSSVEDVTFPFYLPLLSNVRIELHGENKFLITTPRDSYLLKPSTIQSQWAALTFITDSIRRAQDHNFYDQGTTHWWCSNYSEGSSLSPYWRHKHRTEEEQQATTLLDIFGSRKRRKSSPPAEQSAGGGIRLEELRTRAIITEIRHVMHRVDLETATCGSIRCEVELNLKTDLSKERDWINEQILVIYGQMDEPSLILDYLYLGTEWNACNMEELVENGITHILNCTTEIDSFYEKDFKYLRVDVKDVPSANLLQHWQDTYNFIKTCKEQKGKVLVHCQMGVSRSASTTIAYLMGEYQHSFSQALQLTRSKRSCVKPNTGFHKQLQKYEDILANHKHLPDLTDILKATIVNEL